MKLKNKKSPNCNKINPALCTKAIKDALSKIHNTEELTVEKRQINNQLVSLICQLPRKNKDTVTISYSSTDEGKAIEGAIRVLKKRLKKKY